MNEPRGTQEQVSAITDMLNGGEPEEVRDDDTEESPTIEPEQDAQGENLEEGADEAGEDGSQEAEGETPTGEINTVAEFAKAAGWSPEDLYSLKVRLDTGEEIPLGQMKDALQQASRERAEISAAKEQIAQYQQHLRQQEMQMVQGRQQLSKEVEEAQGRVAEAQARYNSVEWEQLAQSDPGRAALLQQQIAADYAGAKRDLEQAFSKQQAIQQQVVARTVQENNEKFLAAVPEWRDPAVAQRESAALDGFLIEKLGFAPEELSTIYDARCGLDGSTVVSTRNLGGKGRRNREESAEACHGPGWSPSGPDESSPVEYFDAESQNLAEAGRPSRCRQCTLRQHLKRKSSWQLPTSTQQT
jgi:hypothetical protein